MKEGALKWLKEKKHMNVLSQETRTWKLSKDANYDGRKLKDGALYTQIITK